MNSHFLPGVKPLLGKGKTGGLLLAAHTAHLHEPWPGEGTASPFWGI